MKIQFGFLLITTILIVLIDWFLAHQWKLMKFGNTFTGKKLAQFWFVFIPAISIVGFIVSLLRMFQENSPGVFLQVSWFFLIVLLIYLPKLAYAFFLFLDFTGQKVLEWTSPKEKSYHYPRISRRKFISQVGIIVATAPFISLLFGVLKGRYAFYTRRVKLSFPNLPKEFDGLRVVQISDLHLGSFGKNREPLSEAIALINAEKPDVILFTGDIVNNFSGELKGWESCFAPLHAPMGKFSILGNHDYGNYSNWPSKEAKRKNFEEIVEGNKKLGFTLLRNQNVLLSRNGATIGLAGVENWGLGRHPRKGDLLLATHGIEEQPFNILMSHDPTHWDEKVLAHNFYDLTLSGHTHGMQFGIEKGNFRWSPAQYVNKRWAGLYREGNKFLYVNRGLGYLGMPARVGMPPEITIFDLHRGEIRSSN